MLQLFHRRGGHLNNVVAKIIIAGNGSLFHAETIVSKQAFHASCFGFRPAANGEDVAREHLHAAIEPHIQKEQREKGSPETSGGAYASRDSPRAQAAPPTEGKSNGNLVKEQTAGATTDPDKSVRKDEKPDATPPGFAGKKRKLPM